MLFKKDLFMQSDHLKKIYIFDCDGVLLNSNKLKILAVKQTLKSLNCSDIFIEWAIEDFRQNFGRTRIEHFSNFVKKSSTYKLKLSPDFINIAIKNYSELVVEAYKNCEVINETLDYIHQVASEDTVWVVSASDQNELVHILPKKIPMIKKTHIYGGPKSKIENIKSIIKNFKDCSFYFYGDSVQDARAALSSNINFIGLTKYSADPEMLSLFCVKNNQKFYTHCLELI